jgi:hypothetical protein
MAKKVTLSEAIVHYAIQDKPGEMAEPLIVKLNGMVRESVNELCGKMAKNLLIDTPLLEDYGYPMEKEEVELSGALANAVEHVITAVEENGLDNIGEAVNEAVRVHGCSMEELENWVESALTEYCAESVEETKNEDIENITYQPYGESMLSSMRESVRSDTDVVVSFENKTATRVSPIEAKAMLEVYNELSMDNKLFFVESASKNIEGFRKVLGFSVQVLGAN